jgi:hypothetical protein
MSQDCSAAAANILSHTDFGIFDLCSSAQATQLLNHFYNLIHASSANWVTTGFQPTPSCDRNTASNLDLSIQAQARSLSSFGKTTGFK